MIKDGVQYGISYLPEGCMAYRDGYRYGAYRKDLRTDEMHVTEWFKTKDEISDFVRKHREYGRGEEATV